VYIAPTEIPGLVMTTVARLARWLLFELQKIQVAIDEVAPEITPDSGLTPGADDAAAWEAALASGGQIDIAAGTYTFTSRVDIPTNVGDIVLNPLGPVVIRWPRSHHALSFNATANVGSDVTVSAIADDITHVASFAQTSTRITGAFSGYNIGDICQIKTNETWGSTGYYMAEMFEVLYNGGTYIITNRKLFHTYTPGSFATTVRRITSRPKLTIKKGITFIPSDPHTSVVVGDFNFAVHVQGAVRADIDVECVGAYAGGIVANGCYDSDFRLRISNCRVDYLNDSFGYGVVELGCGYGNRFWTYGRDAGQLTNCNGVSSMSYGSPWPLLGVPQETNWVESEAISARTNAIGCHRGINTLFKNVVVRGAHITTDDRSSPLETNAMGISLAGVGVRFENVDISGVNTMLNLRDQQDIQTTVNFGTVNFRPFPNGSTSYGLVRINSLQTSGGAAPRPIVVIDDGRVTIADDSYAMRTSIEDPTHDNGYTLICNKLYVDGGSGLVLYGTTGASLQNVYINLHQVTWRAPAAADAVVVVSGTTSISAGERLRIWDLDIVSDDGTNPTGVAHLTGNSTITIPYGKITSNAEMTWTHGSSGAGATVSPEALETTDYLRGNVKRYGAVGDGSTDDTVAIQAAIDNNQTVYLPEGTYAISDTLVLDNAQCIYGDGKNNSIIDYSGADTAVQFISGSGTGTRIYGCKAHDLRITTVSGDTGLDLDSVSEGDFERLIIDGFSVTGVYLHSSTSGGATYNRFFDVKAQSVGVGFLLERDGGGTSSYTNDNTFVSCRANICTTGVEISGGNHNSFIHPQIEQCTTGFAISEPATATCNANTISFARFESNTTTGTIGSSVVNTILDHYVIISGGAITDSGTRTQWAGMYGTQQYYLQSALQSSAGSYRFARTANGGSETPAFVVSDDSSTNSPVTLQVLNPASGAGSSFFRSRYGGDAGTIKFDIECPSGKITGLGTTNGPTGAFTCGAAAATTVNNTCVSANSRIFLVAADPTAGTLTGSTKCLYISARTAATSFQVSTSDGTAAAGTEVFWYWIVN